MAERVRIQVRAKRLGYYRLKRRYEGDVFEITDPKHFARWMSLVNSGDAAKYGINAKVEAKPRAEAIEPEAGAAMSVDEILDAEEDASRSAESLDVI